MKNFSVKFKVLNEEAIEEVFSTFKAYQRLGLADKTSRIIYKGVIVPAGYLDSFEQFMGVYNGIMDGSFIEMMNSISPNLEQDDIHDFLTQCNMERLNQVNSYLHPEKIKEMANRYMVKQKTISAKN